VSLHFDGNTCFADDRVVAYREFTTTTTYGLIQVLVLEQG
jgi:hypothetical protein